MAEDLRLFLQTVCGNHLPGGCTGHGQSSTRLDPGSHTPADHPKDSDSDQPHIKVIPKGLRSFDEHDADFFLELLPGPRDRDGLPESIRFWKDRIEATDPDQTFRVGLIYGPSGCGKSSLVKAGLLTPPGEARPFGLHRGDPGGDRDPGSCGRCGRSALICHLGLGLVDSLAAVRQGQDLAIRSESATGPGPI